MTEEGFSSGYMFVTVLVSVAVVVLLLLAMFTVGPWGSKRWTGSSA
jgi:hypothetical protein